MQQRFSVFWPGTADSPKRIVKILPNVEKGAKWAVVYEPGADVLWWVDDGDVGNVRFTDPARVIVDREGRKNNFKLDFALTDEVKEEFRKLGFVIGREKVDGLLLPGGNTGGQQILKAEPLDPKKPEDAAAAPAAKPANAKLADDAYAKSSIPLDKLDDAINYWGGERNTLTGLAVGTSGDLTPLEVVRRRFDIPHEHEMDFAGMPNARTPHLRHCVIGDAARSAAL